MVSWLITSIAYDAETYQLEYGLDVHLESSDTTFIAQLDGDTDINALNSLFSITIVNLLPFTEYYYKVESVNSFGTAMTEIRTLTTKEASKIHNNNV